MSAWVCSNFHISVLAAYAAEQQSAYTYHKGTRIDLDDAVLTGARLHAENVRSVNHRYNCDEQPVFKFEHRARGASVQFTPVEIIKAARCYEYQSCETDDWTESLAHTIIQGIISDACGALPGYDDAPWGLDGPIDRTPTPARKLGSRMW